MGAIRFDAEQAGCPGDLACSVLRRRLGEPMLGDTPEQPRSWVLVEADVPWGDEPAARNTLLPTWLRQAAEEHGVRLQLVRRPRRSTRLRAATTDPTTAGRDTSPSSTGPDRPATAADRLTVFLVRSEREASWARRGELSHLDERQLPHDVLRQLAQGTTPAWGLSWPHPILLVCTHAKVDACCARFGRPVALALAEDHPRDTWETSHVGGCRYAANILCLPDGVWYGDSTPDLARQQIAVHLAGDVHRDGLRGHSGRPAAVQVLEPVLRAAFGTSSRDAVSVHQMRDAPARGGEERAVLVEATCDDGQGPPRRFVGRVARRTDGPPRPYGCGNHERRVTSSWHVTGYDDVTDRPRPSGGSRPGT